MTTSEAISRPPADPTELTWRDLLGSASASVTHGLNWLDRRTNHFLLHLGAMMFFFFDIMRWSVVGVLAMIGVTRCKAFHPRHVVIQANSSGVNSFGIIALVCFLVGITLVLQTAIVMRFYNQQDMVASVVAISMTRELGPLIASIIFTGRVGAAYTAEIGTMKVQEEILALETMGINPIAYLVVPRFLAAMLMLPCLSILGVFVGILGGYIIGVTTFEINNSTYLDYTRMFLKTKDVWFGTIKAWFFSLLVITIACYKGFTVEGGGEQVGRATMEAVVITLVAIIFSDTVWTLIFNLSK